MIFPFVFVSLVFFFFFNLLYLILFLGTEVKSASCNPLILSSFKTGAVFASFHSSDMTLVLSEFSKTCSSVITSANSLNSQEGS